MVFEIMKSMTANEIIKDARVSHYSILFVAEFLQKFFFLGAVESCSFIFRI